MITPAPIAITGLGVIGAAGPGGPALAAALAAGRPLLSPVDRDAGYHEDGSARQAALVGPLNTGDWIPPLAARRMSPPSRHAVIAAVMALEQAGLAAEAPALVEGGVALATAFGPVSHTERLLRQIESEGPAAASPALFTECVANAPAAQLAIRFGLHGPNYAIGAREAGALMAVGRAATDIREGRVGLALAGAVDELTPLLHSILDRFHALARERNGLDERARPFDRLRNGFVAAEGAAVLVLEERGAAAARRAAILAWVRAWGQAFDWTASRNGWGTGAAALARTLRADLARHDLEPGSIDLIVSGASGSVAGDRLEARMLHALWNGVPLPPVVTPKAVTGEYGGGFLASAVLAASGATFDGGPGFERPDPELWIVPADRTAFRAARRLLVTSVAAGGTASWLVLERP